MVNALITFTIVALCSRLCIATPHPEVQYDPATTKDCIDWINNPGGKTCKEVRDSFNLTPEEFAEWNPSVGVNCDRLWVVASYCILTNQKLSQLTSTAASYTKSVSTSTGIESTSSNTRTVGAALSSKTISGAAKNFGLIWMNVA